MLYFSLYLIVKIKLYFSLYLIVKIKLGFLSDKDLMDAGCRDTLLRNDDGVYSRLERRIKTLPLTLEKV